MLIYYKMISRYVISLIAYWFKKKDNDRNSLLQESSLILITYITNVLYELTFIFHVILYLKISYGQF